MKDYYNGTDCLDAMVRCYGTEAVKYLWRCMKKHETPIEDIKKACDYLNYYLKIDEETK